MRFQKAELCPAAIDQSDLPATFPLGATPPAGGPAWNTIVTVAIATCVFAGAALSPYQTPATLSIFVTSVAAAWIYWASIVLEAVPYVAFGAATAAVAARIQTGRIAAPLVTLILPGCDCALNGFAAALRRSSPALAGFTLTWSAAAGPAALLSTHAVLGDRLLAARVCGAAVAASLTALTWHVFGRAHPLAVHESERSPASLRHLGAALLQLAFTAAVAAIVAVTFSQSLPASNHPLIAAVLGALLSPCSTADAVLGRVLFTGHAAQAVFVIAAQCIDVRQLAMLRNHFGWQRAILAAASGCVGCAAAALVAR